MKIRNIILSLAPLFVFGILTIIGYFAAFALSVIFGLVDVSSADGALVDQGIFSIVRYVLVLVICGLWYYRESWEDRADSRDTFSILIKPGVVISLLVFAAGGQLLVGGVLNLLSSIFPETIASYKELVGKFNGSGSAALIIASIVLAPLAEELIFRGLCMGYLLKAFPVSGRSRGWIAIIFQAIMFGLFHGNVVQIIYGTVMGILFGMVAVKTRSLLPTVFMHTFINALYYPASGLEFNKIPGSVVCIVTGLIMFVIGFGVYFRLYNGYVDKDNVSEKQIIE